MSRKNRSRKHQDPKPRAAAEATPVVDTETLVDPSESSETLDDVATDDTTAADASAGDAVAAIDTVEVVDTVESVDVVESVDIVESVETVVIESDAAASDAVESDVAESDSVESDAVESVAESGADPDVVDVIVDAEAEGDAVVAVAADAPADDAAEEALAADEIGDTIVDVIVESDADAAVVAVDADGNPIAEAPADQEGAVVDEEAVARANAASYDRLKPIIEALIFASPEPLSTKTLFKLLESEPKEDVETALAMLRADYDHPGGLQLVEVAGGFQIVTRPELHEYVRRLFHERTSSKLSVQALETLAVIAYKQPITAPEITEIRGVNTSGVLNTLIDRKLVKIVGRKNVVGRPFMYATTRDFLDKFGLNDLTDLPKVEDLADVLGFEPPSLDANEPAAETLAFDFGEPEEGGLVTLPSVDVPADASVASDAVSDEEPIATSEDDEPIIASDDEEPIMASDDDARIFAIVDEVVEEHADDGVGEQVESASVEDVEEPSVDADHEASHADDAHENASTDTDSEPSSNEDEIN